MNHKIHSLLGIIGPAIGYVAIGISIALSPWFSWERNALSDLGHAMRSDVAAIFNVGLLLTGLLILIYAVTVFRKHAPYTSFVLATVGFSLQLVATYDEVYGLLHTVYPSCSSHHWASRLWSTLRKRSPTWRWPRC